jgi:branched-chain amino acid transport system substrate-binding protein
MKLLLSTLTLAASLLAAPAAQSNTSLKIGFLTTLSGPGAALGQDMRDGFALAVKHNGGQLGGLPLDLQVVDDQLSPESARQSVDRFVKLNKVDILTGVVYSSVLLPVLPAILASDTVYISTNTGPADYAGAKCNRNFFVAAWQNEDIPQAMGRFATTRGYKRVAMIAANYPGGRESALGFKRQFTAPVVEEIYTKMGQLDYAAEIATLRASRPDAVFFFLPGGMGVNFIKQFEAAGLTREVALLAPGYSADEDTIRGVGEPMVGVYNASHWAADLPNALNQKFVADFTTTYGRTPTMAAAQAYDTALLIEHAVRRIGGKIDDRAALRKALREAKFESLRGPFRFNTNQYPIHTLYLRVVQKDPSGRITNKLVGEIMPNHSDPYAAQCKLQ